MSYFLDSLKSKRDKAFPSSPLSKFISVKPPKWILYKDILGDLTLTSLEHCKVHLMYKSSALNEKRSDILEPINDLIITYDEEVFNKFMESMIGKGNNYLYYEYDHPMQSRKIPLRKNKNKEEENTCIHQKTTEVPFL